MTKAECSKCLNSTKACEKKEAYDSLLLKGVVEGKVEEICNGFKPFPDRRSD